MMRFDPLTQTTGVVAMTVAGIRDGKVKKIDEEK